MTNAEWMIKNGYKFGGLSVVYEGTMYKRMKANKKYTLKELGL